jgi:DNA-binding transcriptional regulator YiaG
MIWPLRFESTTAGVAEGVRASMLVGALLGHFTTSSLHQEPPARFRLEATNAGVSTERQEVAIVQIRQLSGLTWEQLAELCGTSRRTLHLWASGRRMQPANEERLLRILGVLRQMDRGSSAENRTRLLVVRPDGRRLLDLLARGLFADVMEALDLQTDLPVRAASRSPAPLPRDRRPPSPADLFDAEQGPAHVERGRHPKARLGRLRRGK